MDHVCGIVLPIVYEKVFDQENQRPVKIVHRYVKIAEHPICPFDAGMFVDKVRDQFEQGISRPNKLMPIAFLAQLHFQ